MKKSISLPDDLGRAIEEYSKQQRRSFSAQLAVWAEEKLREENLYPEKKPKGILHTEETGTYKV